MPSELSKISLDDMQLNILVASLGAEAEVKAQEQVHKKRKKNARS